MRETAIACMRCQKKPCFDSCEAKSCALRRRRDKPMTQVSLSWCGAPRRFPKKFVVCCWKLIYAAAAAEAAMPHAFHAPNSERGNNSFTIVEKRVRTKCAAAILERDAFVRGNLHAGGHHYRGRGVTRALGRNRDHHRPREALGCFAQPQTGSGFADRRHRYVKLRPAGRREPRMGAAEIRP
jgi:hypothetical protein